jgi:hypothetical protein
MAESSVWDGGSGASSRQRSGTVSADANAGHMRMRVRLRLASNGIESESKRPAKGRAWKCPPVKLGRRPCGLSRRVAFSDDSPVTWYRRGPHSFVRFRRRIAMCDDVLVASDHDIQECASGDLGYDDLSADLT